MANVDRIELVGEELGSVQSIDGQVRDLQLAHSELRGDFVRTELATLAEIDDQLRALAAGADAELEIVQSNHEGEEGGDIRCPEDRL